MNFYKHLQEIGLHTENCVVIGSGILSACNIRKSNDIDVVVSEAEYRTLHDSNSFVVNESHGQEVLTNELFEIFTSWNVLDNQYDFDSLTEQSVVINDVRYVSLPFLLRVKQSWVQNENPRQKDINDVKLIKDYLAQQSDL